MAFPIPHFEDLDDQELTSESIAQWNTVETPFSLNRYHAFTSPTRNNLLYDEDRPLYKMPSGSCVIYVAKSPQEQLYAIKCSRFVKRIRNEYNSYRSIGRHPTIVACYDMWVQGGKGFLQLELAKCGSIKGVLKSLSNDQIWRVVSHISLALKEIHSAGYMHLDVSPANILHTEIASIGTVYKLSDLGTLLKVGSFEEDDEGAGPYVSPEALSFTHDNIHSKVTEKTDIYSFGLVLYELLTKRNVPREYPGYEQLRNGTYKFQTLPEDFGFVIDMMNPNPEKRPSAEEILELDRCKEEIEVLEYAANELSNPVYKTMKEAKTPELTTVKAAPETPYSKKYPGRKLFLDDDDFSNEADL